MKLLCATLAAALTLGLGAPLTAQTRTAQPQRTRTFTISDGVFEFRYPRSYILCGEDEDPDRSCSAYMAVCLNSDGVEHAPDACVAYPAGEYRHTDFEAAAFSVRALKADSEAECLAPNPGVRYHRIHTGRINRTTFKVFYSAGVGLGHYGQETTYRNFHNNRCYELGIRISQSNYRNYEPGTVEEFTQASRRKVYRSLRRILRSFRFLQ